MKNGHSGSLSQALAAHVAAAVEHIPTEGGVSAVLESARSGSGPARQCRRLQSEQLLEIRILELRALHGKKARREEAFADLVGIHSQHLLRIAIRIACLWGLLEPIETAQAAVVSTARQSFRSLASYELPRRNQPGTFFRWLCRLLFRQLREVRDEQVATVLADIGVQRILRCLCRGPIIPSRQKFEPSALQGLIELASSNERANLLDARFVRSQTGLHWTDLLSVLGQSESKKESRRRK